MIGPDQLEIETLDRSAGHCDCCGNDCHAVWGMVHQKDGSTLAAYWMRWAEGHLSDPGATLDLVMGAWGDGTNSSDRCAISLIHRQQDNGKPVLMVVDAQQDRRQFESLADTALKRSEVIGTPLAQQVFAIVDAIYLRDDRLF